MLAYEGAVPADLVLLCGVFGNISATGHRQHHQSSEQSFVGPVAVWQREPGSKESSVAHGDAGFSLNAHRIIAGAAVVEEDHVGATAE